MQDVEQESSLLETVTNVVGILRRRRWWIAIPACLIPLGFVVVLYQLPNRYTSEATLLVVQQQVPERYVTPTATTDLNQALMAMTEEVLSRTRLLGIIEEFGLYRSEKKRLAAEQLVERMRRDVSITPLQSNPERREVNAFKIAFITDSPNLAQEVTSRLTTLFIEENVKRRAEQSTTTTRFLNEQMDAAKTKLNEQEERVRDFKMQHLGELPEQQPGNLGILSSLQSQLDNAMSSLNRARQQRLYLEWSLIEESRRVTQPRTAIFESARERESMNPAEIARRDLAALEAERRHLLEVYTPQHPTVVKNAQDIAQQMELIKSLDGGGRKGDAPATTEAVGPAPARKPLGIRTPESAGSTVLGAQLRSQLEANRLEIDNLTKTEAKLKGQVEQYQARLNQTPVREQQLASMVRDLELLKENYSDLLKKEQESQLATSLEKRQEGQQFRLIDPPLLPAVPSSPKRLKMSLGGLAAGLAVGLGLALFMEMRSPSFHTEKAVTQQLALPFVVGIPQLLTSSETQKIAWTRRFEWVAAMVMVTAVSVAEFYVFRHQ